MNVRSIHFLLIIFFLAAPQVVFSKQDRFQTTAQEMIDVLSKKPVKYRSLGIKKRAIKRLERQEDTVVETTVYVDESVSIPKVKAKIYFDYNSPNLRSESFGLLNEVGKALNSVELKNQAILINGHTDSDGEDKYNLKLSLERAFSVKNYLVGTCKINSDRIKVVGYGEALPLKPNNSDENKQINRRVEFEVVQQVN